MVLLDFAGERLETRSWGAPRADATPVVLLHHGFGHADGWGEFPQRLHAATGRYVIAYSRAGCGHSAPRRLRAARGEIFEFEATRILPALLESYGLEKASLYGHSDGGTIALMAAARMPNRIDRLIAEAPHVFVESQIIEAVARVARGYGGESGLRRALARHHASPDVAFAAWRDMWLDPEFAHWSIEHLLPDIRAPLLLIQGADDEFGSRAQVDVIHEGTGGPATTRFVANCRHLPHVERADLPQWVADFLNGPPTVGKLWLDVS
jgi:pimeloyl-ACP methyl ester carboxylesterase